MKRRAAVRHRPRPWPAATVSALCLALILQGCAFPTAFRNSQGDGGGEETDRSGGPALSPGPFAVSDTAAVVVPAVPPGMRVVMAEDFESPAEYFMESPAPVAMWKTVDSDSIRELRLMGLVGDEEALRAEPASRQPKPLAVSLPAAGGPGGSLRPPPLKNAGEDDAERKRALTPLRMLGPAPLPNAAGPSMPAARPLRPPADDERLAGLANLSASGLPFPSGIIIEPIVFADPTKN